VRTKLVAIEIRREEEQEEAQDGGQVTSARGCVEGNCGFGNINTDLNHSIPLLLLVESFLVYFFFFFCSLMGLSFC